MEKTNNTDALILEFVRKISEATRLKNDGKEKESLVASDEAEKIAVKLGMNSEAILIAGSKLI